MRTTPHYVYINGEQASTQSSLEDAIEAGGTDSFEVWADGQLVYTATSLQPDWEIGLTELQATRNILDKVSKYYPVLGEKEAAILHDAIGVLNALASDYRR